MKEVAIMMVSATNIDSTFLINKQNLLYILKAQVPDSGSDKPPTVPCIF